MTSVTLATLAVNAILGYVDPGSGSYLFQILIAGFSATALFWREARERFATRLKRRRETAAKDQNSPAAKD